MNKAYLFPYIVFLLASCGGGTQVQQQGNAAASSTVTEPAATEPITVCAPPPTSDTLWYTQNKKAPLFDGLEGVHYKITTSNPEAQRYFDQGLMLAYGFNHAEAARSFFEATRQDSTCAMCYWGYSYVLGPNYNGGMEADNFTRAYDAVQQASKLAGKASTREQALIRALEERYPPAPVDDRGPYDVAYAEAMQQVYKQFPQDPEIGALYAESRMDLHPWDLWQKNGQPQPWTEEIVRTLQSVMQLNPRHVGANHFYIHATEASKHPEEANGSAELLETLVPGAGHLLHMPSHTYIRTGNYHAGTLSNLRALKADSAYTTACYAQGAYPLAYYPHNYHFMAATATLEGNSRLAMLGAEKLAAHVDIDIMKQAGWETLQHYYTIPYMVASKFGLWDQLLQMKNADTTLIYPEIIRHYARGIAYLGKKEVANAKAELSELKVLIDEEELKKMTIWGINSMYDIAHIAQLVLEGEVLAAEGAHDKSILLLREAVAVEDKLNYNEPPDWFFSVRHHLGNVLLQAEQYEEAAKVYEQDLETLPKNGWALSGLSMAYDGLGSTSKAKQTKKDFEVAWQWADIKLAASEVER